MNGKASGFQAHGLAEEFRMGRGTTTVNGEPVNLSNHQ